MTVRRDLCSLGVLGLAAIASLAAPTGCGSSSGGSNGAAGDDGGSSGASSSGVSSGSGSGSGGRLGRDVLGIEQRRRRERRAGVVGGVPGGKAGPGTTLQGCQIFPPDNPWNTAIDGPDVQVIHTYDSQLSQSKSLHPDWGDYTTNHYGIPYNVVPASQADDTVVFNYAADESDPGPERMDRHEPRDGRLQDGHHRVPLLLRDEDRGRPRNRWHSRGACPAISTRSSSSRGRAAASCTRRGTASAVINDAPFKCANGAVFDLTSNTLRTAGWTSADAAGLSILAGLVRLAEVQAGAINHAIRVTFNSTAAEQVHPPGDARCGPPKSNPTLPWGCAFASSPACRSRPIRRGRRPS